MTSPVDQGPQHPRIYVVSTGRAGSTFLARLLSRLEGSSPVGHQVASSRVLNVAGNILLHVRSEKAQQRAAAGLLHRLNALESTADPLQSVLLTLYLRNSEGLANERILHLVRDPRDFVSSFMNWKNRRLSGRVAHHLVPFWQPSPLFRDGIGPLGRMRMSKFEHFCWVWTCKNRLFQSLERRRERYLRVRLEDITGPNAEEELRRIVRFVGAGEFEGAKEILAKKQNVSPATGFPSWREWDSQLAHILDSRCGNEMKVYGYGFESDWIAMRSSAQTQVVT